MAKHNDDWSIFNLHYKRLLDQKKHELQGEHVMLQVFETYEELCFQAIRGIRRPSAEIVWENALDMHRPEVHSDPKGIIMKDQVAT